MALSVPGAPIRAFYWRWIKTAFRHAFGYVDLWSGVFGAGLGGLDHYWPQLGLLSSYAWLIPIWMLLSVAVVRLVLAPYWMWQEDQNAPVRPTLEARKRLSHLRGEGVKIRNEGAVLQHDLPGWVAETKRWMEETTAAIAAIDEADAIWFQTLDTLPPARVGMQPMQGSKLKAQHIKAFNEHDCRLTRLDQLIQKFGETRGT